MSMLDECAVEVGQFSQPGLVHELVGYYEPAQVNDLTRHGRLLVVADGMGGAASGEIAGRYAIQKILHEFYHSREMDVEKRLLEIIRQVNRAIFEQNRRHPDRRVIATTLLVALIHHHKLIVAGVGDGRAYVVWDQDIEYLNGEISSPQRQARESEANSNGVPKKNGLVEPSPEQKEPNPPDSSEEESIAKDSAKEAKSRLLAEKEALASNSTPPSPPLLPPCALGLAEQIEINLFSRFLFPGDIVVLCSGGLNGYVSEAEIAQAVTQQPPALAGRYLAELAGNRGSRDILSVSVTRVLSKPITQVAPARQPMPAAPDWDSLTKSITKPLPVNSPQLARQLTEPQHRWFIYLIALAALLLFGLIGFLAGGYLTPGDSASEIGQVQHGEGAKSISEEGQAKENPPTSSQQTGNQDRANTSIQTTLTPGGVVVVERNSPPATPADTSSNLRSVAVITPTIPTPQPKPIPTIVLPSGCTNKARFAGDVTVKDGTEFAPGEAFEKVWSVANYGTCPWGGGYTVRFTGGDLMGVTESAPLLVVVQPKATGAISVPMVAPTSEGTYRSNWQLHSLTGEAFGPNLYLEIKVLPGILPVSITKTTTLYDFVANAAQATWTAGDETYNVVEAPIDRSLIIPDPQGIVVVGPTELRGNVVDSNKVLMTHPHLEFGFIEGVYTITTPLQPTDLVMGSLGLPKAAAINDDGVTFELVFKPVGGQNQLLFSKLVKYEDSPVAVTQTLNTLQPGQTGVFTLRVKGGDSLSYDWATWIELRLARPQ